MPMYEYTCEKCKNTFEKRRGMSDRHAPCECPSCGGNSTLAVSANSRQSENWAETGYTPTSTASAQKAKQMLKR